MTFQDNLESAWKQNGSLLCVGLDSEWERLPKSVLSKEHPQFIFNQKIIEATNSYVCAYKLNVAFYEKNGADGITNLKKTCDYLKENFPDILLIIDAKRGDIGNTNRGYVDFIFKHLRADAITLNPYLGREALNPFLDRKDKGCIILCRTSNSGAGEIQDLKVGKKPLYEIIAEKVVNEWNINKNCLLVVGGTHPEEMVKIRKLTKDMTFLVPGVGTQGGEIKKILAAGLTRDKNGLIINVSRKVIFASPDDDFPVRARETALEIVKEINRYRN